MTLQRDLMKHLMIAFVTPTLIAFSFHEISIQFYTSATKHESESYILRLMLKGEILTLRRCVTSTPLFCRIERLLGSVTLHLDLRTRFERRKWHWKFPFRQLLNTHWKQFTTPVKNINMLLSKIFICSPYCYKLRLSLSLLHDISKLCTHL